MLNLFADIKLGQFLNGPAYLRVGRQELLYGSQRLISTLDWVNTRRTFQGIKGFLANAYFRSGCLFYPTDGYRKESV